MTWNIFKDVLTTIFGTLLMIFAASCYFFNWPKDANVMHNVAEAAVGFILLFIDKGRVADVLFNAFKKKVQ